MITSENITNFSKIVGKLSIFLFIIAGNFVGDIYSCGLRHIFNEFILVKHIIGFFILLFFVGLVQENIDFKIRIIQSVILYIWFIFIMRSPMIITLFVIFIIIFIFLIDLYIGDLKNKIEKIKENIDKTNEKDNTNKINGINYNENKYNENKYNENKYNENNENKDNENKDNKKIKLYDNEIIKYSYISNYLFIISFFTTILGTLFYIYILKKSLGNQFTIYKFLLGHRDQECFIPEIYNKFKKNPFIYDIDTHKYNFIKNKKINKNDFLPSKMQKKIIQ